MADIKLFVCCHERQAVPAHPLLRPLQVGAVLAEERLPGFAHDDEGESISDKNRSYCELTGQYWAWKNVRADWYGFFHYRRYLYPDPAARRPYIVRREPDLDALGYDRFKALIEQYDMILPLGEDMRVPVREHYAGAHRAADLALAEELVLRTHPEMGQALDAYLSGTKQYFGNIFIMGRDVFQDYCAWLFPLLAVFDAEAADRPPRVDGYIAERLLGVYAAYRRHELRTLELPRVHFYTGGAYYRRRALNALLPPGSVSRMRIKACMTGIGRKKQRCK